MNTTISAVPLAPSLTIASLTVRTVDVPLLPPLQTAAGTISSAPLVLLDLHTEQGIVGRSYLFAYTRAALAPLAIMLTNLEPMTIGQAVAPVALSKALASRFRLLGTQGLVGMALAALDMAAWDARARASNLPLARLLGAQGDEPIPAYASLRSWTASDVAEEAGRAVSAGFRAVKLKFGHPKLASEYEVFHAVRDAVGDDVAIFVDPNQVFTVPEAINRAHHYAHWGIGWLEEPVRADDLAGHAAISRACPRLPIQRGENDWGPDGVAKTISANSCSLIMLDAIKVGGVTGWMAAAALTDAAGLPTSSHLFVEYSAHLLAVTANRHWLEWLDLARPILRSGSPALSDGGVRPSAAPGVGLEWDEAAVAKYAVQD